ncbi:MAG: ShlB/FhaC/HecB family hemolysin secretion/activation protein [Sphingobium sp.]
MKPLYRGALLIACTVPGVLSAQETAPPDAPRERTGPNAAPAPRPDFATETPPLLPTPIPAPALAPATPTYGDLYLGDVLVTSDRPGFAPARRDWVPLTAAGDTLHVSLTPGEAMDANWVRRQFFENGLMGTTTSYDRLVALVQEINRVFIANGYINSGVLIASQPVLKWGDPLKLRLVYGTVGDRLTVQWGRRGSQGMGAAYIDDRMKAARRTPLNAAALERDFRRLAADPALAAINADLQPGNAPGEARLLLTVDPQYWSDFYLTLANSRSPSVGGLRSAAGGSLRYVLTSGDLMTGEVGVTKGVTDGQASYTAPLTPALGISLRGGINDAAVVDPLLAPLNISSRDWNVEGGLSLRVIDDPLLPTATPGKWSPNRTLTLGVLFGHRETRDKLFGQPFSFSAGSVNGFSRYNVLRFVTDFLNRNVNEVISVSLTTSLGLGGTGSDIPGVATPMRHFATILAQANYARRLNDHGLEFHARLTGQTTNSILYAAERLSVGGEASVRGYRENFTLADRGVIGTLELSQPFSLSGSAARAKSNDLGAFTLTVFADGAYVGDVGRGPPPVRKLASIGVSLAWTPHPAFFAQISYGEALTDRRSDASGELQDKGFQFRVTFRPLTLFRRTTAR